MTNEQLQRRLNRERAARKEAESLLEQKSSALYELNQQLHGVNRRLEHQAVELVAAHQVALESARLKSQFLANMSHEIRTPMNGVLGMLNLLLEGDLQDEQLDFTQTARRSAEALLHIINDILDFSRIEAGKLTLETVDFELRTEIEDSLELMAEKADAAGLGLWCEFDPLLPYVVSGDPGRIRQVLLNLLGNALKFTHHGDVTLRVTVAQETPGDRIRLEVTDSGIGISVEHQAKLFQPFVQADGSTTRKYGGTGLGLSIARELVRLMGGEIGVVSRPGSGSTFWFEIPLQVRRAAESTDRIFLRGRRVLVVDDNRTNREILLNVLRSWEMPAAEATGAVEGMELLLAAQTDGEPFDIAIVDMQMPEVDGIAFAKRVKAESGLQNIEMILLTSLGQRSLCKSLTGYGFSACLCKPVRESHLLLTLEHVMSGSRIPSKAIPPEVPEPLFPSPGSVGGASLGRILIADDNRVNQKVAAHFVQQLGYSIRMVANGLEAVEAAKTGEFELVLMDCHMPQMDGFEATARIRGLDCSIRDLPIVAVTANAMKGDRERCLAAGMNDYLSKPFRPQELKAVIERYVGVPGGA